MHQSAPNGVWTFDLFTQVGIGFKFGLAWIGWKQWCSFEQHEAKSWKCNHILSRCCNTMNIFPLTPRNYIHSLLFCFASYVLMEAH